MIGAGRTPAGWVLVVAMLVLAPPSPAKPARQPLTPATVHWEIARLGVDRFVHRAYDDNRNHGADWYEIMDHVGRGEAAWMPIARELGKMEAPVAPAEELDTYLSRGLSAAPQNVLPLLTLRDRSWGRVDSICGVPNVDWKSIKEQLQYKAKTLRALQLVYDPKFRIVRDACIRSLRAASIRD